VQFKQLFRGSSWRAKSCATLLLIEDEATVCTSLANGLTLLGFCVLQAENGLAAESIYRSVPIDIVITDLIMPEKDGIETILGLHKERPKLPVIAMAEPKTPKVVVTAASLLGVKAVLQKPCTAAGLAAAVRNVMGSGANGDPGASPTGEQHQMTEEVSFSPDSSTQGALPHTKGIQEDVLHGPFRLTDRVIDTEVTRISAGVYALDNCATSRSFHITCVGRSDGNLNNQLHVHVGAYKYFKYGYCSSSKAAFEKECSLYHGFVPQYNAGHPVRSAVTDWVCPQCL
jgi:DNA-binding response OmpR family regulator